MFRNDELIKRIRGLPNGWINKIEKKNKIFYAPVY